jgi:hypothetical protein
MKRPIFKKLGLWLIALMPTATAEHIRHLQDENKELKRKNKALAAALNQEAA